MMAQPLREKNGFHWRYVLDTLWVVTNFQEDGFDNCLKLDEEWRVFTSKCTSTSHPGVQNAPWDTHLRSFDRSIRMEEEGSSLAMLT